MEVYTIQHSSIIASGVEKIGQMVEDLYDFEKNCTDGVVHLRIREDGGRDEGYILNCNWRYLCALIKVSMVTLTNFRNNVQPSITSQIEKKRIPCSPIHSFEHDGFLNIDLWVCRNIIEARFLPTYLPACLPSSAVTS